MKWLEIKVETLSGLGVELATAALMEAGIEGVQTLDDYETRLFLENNPDFWDYADDKLLQAEEGAAFLVFYLPKDDKDTLEAARRSLGGLKAGEFGHNLGSLEIRSRIVDDEDWAENWKNYYKPFRVGKGLVVRPEWENYAASPGDVVLSLNPGQVFGTGLHQTTRMCLEAMENLDLRGKSILDLGCGSGILALSALLFGAKKAVAVDTDSLAEQVVTENAALNGITSDKLVIRTGNVLKDPALLSSLGGNYDLILANIIADVVIEMTPLVKGLLSPKGCFISSGIIAGRLDDVLARLEANRFKTITIIRRDEWAAVISGL